MAQFGKNFYGASYYGASGVYHGQFLSDETALLAPLAAPSLVFDIRADLTKVEYPHASDIFRYEGAWTTTASGKSSTDAAMKAVASLTCSDIELKCARVAGGAIANVKLTRYISGVAQTPTNYTINSGTTDTLQLANLPYGEYAIEITRNGSSPVGSAFQLKSISAVTDDVSLEIRSTTQDIANKAWGNWTPVTLTRTYNSLTDDYTVSGTATGLSNILGYQFKLMLASSDNTTSPEIISTDIHTGSNVDYSKSGIWKMAVDLGPGVQEIKKVTYVATETSDANVAIRTRATNDAGLNSWSYWTVPYSHSAKRALLDIKADPSLRQGYIISPLYSPENLARWISFLPSMFISSKDPLTGDIMNNNSITIELLDSNLETIVMNSVRQSFKFTEMKNIERSIALITTPLRVKISFTRTLGSPTPAIDSVLLSAEADYTETRSFNRNEIIAYGSAVFGNNTGKDAVYMDGLARTQLASISNLGFAFPDGVASAEYSIANINMPGYPADVLKLYWASEKDKENKSSKIRLGGSLTDDHVMVEMREDGNVVKRHKQYCSGITIKVDNVGKTNYDSNTVTNVFSPSIDMSKTYAYHVANGFSVDTFNPNVDIRWQSENSVDSEDRRNIVYQAGQKVLASITTATIGGIVDWKSDEKIFPAIVNEGSPIIPNLSRITLTSDLHLPEIPGDIIASENPYVVEVIDGSVISEGETRESNRIQMTIDNMATIYEPFTEPMVEMIKSNSTEDFLPKARTIDVLGIYASKDSTSVDFVEGMHFTVVDGNKIDWSIGVDNQLAVPQAGDTIYITYTYEKVNRLAITATSNYSRYSYDIMNIYRTSPKKYSGRCSYGVDYISDVYDINTLWPNLDPKVDTTTLKLRAVVANNDFVHAYIKNSRVVGTLADVNPKENWHPHIKDGHYYIGKDEHYLFINPKVVSLSGSEVPLAQNVAYTDGIMKSGILVQEATINLLKNGKFDTTEELNQIFMDRFER